MLSRHDSSLMSMRQSSFCSIAPSLAVDHHSSALAGVLPPDNEMRHAERFRRECGGSAFGFNHGPVDFELDGVGLSLPAENDRVDRSLREKGPSLYRHAGECRRGHECPRMLA